MTATAPPGGVLDRLVDRSGSLRAVAVLRWIIGPVVLIHLWPFLADTARGVTFDERFHEPWWSFVPTVPGWVQVVLVWAGAVGAIGLTVGYRSRWSGAIAWVGVTANLLLSQHHFRHNRAFLVIVLGAVVLAGPGRVLSWDAWRHRRRTGVAASAQGLLWPVTLVQVLVASVYGASGLSKLIDPDWIGGLVLWDRAVRYEHAVRAIALPGPVADGFADFVTQRWVHRIGSPVAVAMELGIAAGLWFGRTRLAAVWTAVLFHASIEIAARVEVFSLLAIAALSIWVTPHERSRGVTVSDGRWIRRLDWLGRFEVTERSGATCTVRDVDGTVHAGRYAWWLVASRLPILFPFVAPLRPWCRPVRMTA